MAINGSSRILQANAQLKKLSYPEMNKQFKNEVEEVKATKKYTSLSAVEHNHSEESLHNRK